MVVGDIVVFYWVSEHSITVCRPLWRDTRCSICVLWTRHDEGSGSSGYCCKFHLFVALYRTVNSYCHIAECQFRCFTIPLTYWHCLHSMWSRVCVILCCPTICLSVHLFHRLSVPTWAHSKPAAAGLLLWPGGQEILIDCCMYDTQQQPWVNAGSYVVSIHTT